MLSHMLGRINRALPTNQWSLSAINICTNTFNTFLWMTKNYNQIIFKEG